MIKNWLLNARDVSRQQAADTGMALALLLLWAGFALERTWPFRAAALVLVLAMAAPLAFGPAAALWFGLARVLGAISSRVVLCIVFFGLVAPIGVLRRITGHDPLSLRRYRNGSGSLFKVRNKRYQPGDLQYPY
jgi:hypothetical protein